MYNQQVRDTGFYQTKAWRDCRNGYYKHKHGLCERCSAPGKIVHHKVYITLDNLNDPSITLNWDNLELLCADCHNKEHFAKHRPLREGLMFDEQGNVVLDTDYIPPYE